MHLYSRKTRNFPCLGSSAHEEAPQIDRPAAEKEASVTGGVRSFAWGRLSQVKSDYSRRCRCCLLTLVVQWGSRGMIVRIAQCRHLQALADLQTGNTRPPEIVQGA